MSAKRRSPLHVRTHSMYADARAELVDLRRQRQDPDVRGAYRREQRKRAAADAGHHPVVIEDPIGRNDAPLTPTEPGP